MQMVTIGPFHASLCYGLELHSGVHSRQYPWIISSDVFLPPPENQNVNTFAVRRHCVVILTLRALAISALSSANTEFSTYLTSLQAQARSAGINETTRVF